MSFARLLRGLKFRYTRPKQNSSCHILNLPIEIVILILEYLPQYQQIILSQTCYPLRCIILDYNKAHKDSGNLLLSANLNQHQRLEYLFALAHSRPNIWACHRCTKLHPIKNLGIPILRQFKFECLKADDYYMQGEYTAWSGHIQFALKYSRLQNEDKKAISRLKRSDKWYLDNLLEPFSAPIRPSKYGMTDKIKGTLRIFPKIIDGQFLIHSVRTFTKDTGNVSRQSIGHFRICPHQYWNPWGYPDSGLLTIQCIEETYTNLRRGFAVVSAYAFLLGREVYHSCVFCETDFAIQASSEVAVVQVWQNLGSEATYPKNLSWHWQADFTHRDLVYSQRGRIRELYDQGAV